MGILAGEEGGPAGRADRIGNEGVGEARSFRSKVIQVGDFIDLRAICGNSVLGMILLGHQWKDERLRSLLINLAD